MFKLFSQTILLWYYQPNLTKNQSFKKLLSSPKLITWTMNLEPISIDWVSIIALRKNFNSAVNGPASMVCKFSTTTLFLYFYLLTLSSITPAKILSYYAGANIYKNFCQQSTIINLWILQKSMDIKFFPVDQIIILMWCNNIEVNEKTNSKHSYTKQEKF